MCPKTEQWAGLADALLVWVDSPRPVKPWFRVESLVNGCVERELPSLRGRKVGSGRQRAQVPLVPSTFDRSTHAEVVLGEPDSAPAPGGTARITRACGYAREAGEAVSLATLISEIVVNRERFAIEGRCALEIAGVKRKVTEAVKRARNSVLVTALAIDCHRLLEHCRAGFELPGAAELLAKEMQGPRDPLVVANPTEGRQRLLAQGLRPIQVPPSPGDDAEPKNNTTTPSPSSPSLRWSARLSLSTRSAIA